MERDAKGKRDKTSARKVVRIRPGTKSVVLGVTGSIAAYKSAELTSLLVKQGHEVFVSKTLVGEPVGLKSLDHDRWELYFGPLVLGIVDARRGKVLRPRTRSV